MHVDGRKCTTISKMGSKKRELNEDMLCQNLFVCCDLIWITAILVSLLCVSSKIWVKSTLFGIEIANLQVER